MKQVEIYTDGACSGNPGPGGWGAILIYGDHTKELSGGHAHTTNNQMEMLACIESLKALKEKCDVVITTDSKYVKDGITSWILGWKKRNWKNAKGQPVKNKDLWLQLDQLVTYHNVKWKWVKGHNGHPLNERADKLAVQAIPR